jgi:hypothetical protein
MNSFELFWKNRPPKLETAKDSFVAGLRLAVEIGKKEMAVPFNPDSDWDTAWHSSCKHYVEAIESEISLIEGPPNRDRAS